MNRRTLVFGMGAAASAGGLWACVRRGDRAALSSEQQELLARVSDLTIPASDTPGAMETQTPEFVALALAHGVGGHEPALVDRLAGELEQAGGGRFTRLDAAAQASALQKLDEAAFAQNAATGEAWRAIKSLIATGYYTSEAGASRELQYELVPGRFDPDVPLTADARAFSSDWTSVDFG
ncbi:MAG: gluconate 2-dehydrogenase subunit 3 family protein [Hyphomonadaceae bacterium]|nr:gluconate 2-dehydrogenase subunit 3 family protein [Hyphomonadaceae bacterium]